MLTLTDSQKAIFLLVSGEKVCDQNADWNAIMREGLDQAVFLMLKQPDNLPSAIASKWQDLHYQMVSSNLQEFFAITETDRIMRSINQPYVIIKGISSASYYPDFGLRALGDVDFLIDPRYQDGIEKTLISEGYKPMSPGEHHIAFMKDNQDLEMHFTIPGVPKGEAGDIVRQYISPILNETVEYEKDGYVINLPLPKYHGLIILLHTQQHMTSGGFGLRHLMDWCYFVDKTQHDTFWQTDLLPVLEKIGLLYFARVLTMTGNLYLHTVLPDWCGQVDEKVCDELMHDILKGGNFGRKDISRSGSGLMLTKYKNQKRKRGKVVNLWITLLGGAAGYHPVVKKYPVLYPIFIVDFLLRRLKHVLTGKRQPLWKSVKNANEREHLYEQLHLFEVIK